ncbi:bifunctional hydroxymethylpyrimidine kinase/phosphomethylpyrimidine kinase [Paracoccus aerodenitrificans]|uniref:bifunctional hydroxymethylpyrimidine kinase/phosphomethylpyrimidine kinase n=1 Tax=Paracoccus aerodenitrificans TaxID=3017781 RepID=UPI0022EFFE29|nr:bifunctional hydroxymethylpyrimidine kinase/phosphomethylpyrimidine kinase [Paracoccus aerodenitrificans]WBU64624.1 bifunctional hydroxymethylpyrimidine kinase/phosphomethylpyrimidine kinase [Paracoccus aerodenitrificans]
MGKVAKLLVIAGSDSGGGAGIQADVKTASALGVYAATAITAITAQNTRTVAAVEMLSPQIVAQQIATVLEDIRIDAIKIGMLGTAAITQAVSDALQGFSGPVVLDPVMVAKSGDVLLQDDAIAALRELLLPRATLLTPNLPEAAQLLGTEQATGSDQIGEQADALRDLGPEAVLMKGGHASGTSCVDLLVDRERVTTFELPRLSTRNTHGTGCSLSSAIASEMAKGAAVETAVSRAHGWLHGAIAAANSLHVGHGHGPVHHFHEVWS